MEIIVELLLQFFGAILQFFGELLVQMVLEAVAEVFGHRVRRSLGRPRPVPPALAATGYLVLGALAGSLSLWLLPTLFIEAQWLRLLNLLLTPLAAGLIMERIGAWRRARDKDVIRIETFAYGFLFALAMAVVRFVWGQ